MKDLIISTNGINLHVVQEGSDSGEPIILLHGFPEFWYGWRKQMTYLADKGYRVLAPDQRGYNLSDKPEDISAYSVDELAKDVIGIIDWLGVDQSCLVGHDWGATAAWWTALKYPERIKRLVIANVPHPAVMAANLSGSNIPQMSKSWYIFYYQLPGLAEKLCSRNNFEYLATSLSDTSMEGSFSQEDIETYKQAWAQPGAITGMVNWYRAFMQVRPQKLKSKRVTVPTLLIWGEQDPFLSKEMAQPSIELCDNGRLVFIENATHWVQHDQAEKVNHLLYNFLLESN